MDVKPEPTITDRGLAKWPPTSTSYGAEVLVYESSAAEAPHIWLGVDQPEPATSSPPELPAAIATAHMTLEQAEEVHANLGAAIEYVKKTWSG